MANDAPKSLFITNVTDLKAINAGGFGRVSKGLHRGKTVAVKELYKVCHEVRVFPCFIFEIILICCEEFTPTGIV